MRDEILERALDFRSALASELGKIDRYLEAHDELFGTDHTRAKPARISTGRHPRAKPPGKPREISSIIIEMMKASDGPLKRSEITDRLLATGVLSNTQYPARYVGTLLFRNQDLFERMPDGSGWRVRSA